MALTITQLDMNLADAVRCELAKMLLTGVAGVTPTAEPNDGGTSIFNMGGILSAIVPPITSVPSMSLDCLETIALAIIRAYRSTAITPTAFPPLRLPLYASTNLPPANQWVGCMVYVTNIGWAAVSNGTNWYQTNGTLIV